MRSASSLPLIQKAKAALQRIDAADRRRVRSPVVVRGAGRALCADGVERQVFCSNDYLGLASDQRIAEASHRADSVGSTASQHVCGFHRLQQQLETELADFLGADRAIVGGSGYAMNTGAIPVLASAVETIYSDTLNHASLIDGCRLSRRSVRRYPHNAVEALPKDAPAQPGSELLVTDAMFSMDGDVARLRDLMNWATPRGAALYVDDAHGFGWAGDGRGHVAQVRLDPNALVQMVTFGKSLGSYGAALAGHADVIEWLLQSGRTTMFATALPPGVLAATLEALRIVRDEPEHRLRLLENVRRFRAACHAAGVDLLNANGPVQAVLLGAEARALLWQRALWEAGFWVNAIRPPTVPEGTARLRITLSASHGASDIRALVDALAEIAASETAFSRSA